MRIAVPKEIKNHEHRVGLTPTSVRELTAAGQRVLVQSGAGAGAGMDDAQYRAAGAELVDSAAELFARAELVVKVKEPQAQECALLRPGQVLFKHGLRNSLVPVVTVLGPVGPVVVGDPASQVLRQGADASNLPALPKDFGERHWCAGHGNTSS